MEIEVALPLTLRPSRLRYVGFLVVSSVFVAAGLWMSSETRLGHLVTGFFGILFVVFAAQLLPNCSYLHLTHEGFTFRSLFRSHTVRWSDVAEFGVVKIANDMVAWNYAPHYQAQMKGRVVSAALTGVEAALPDTYGMKAEHLAALMNDLRQKFGDC